MSNHRPASTKTVRLPRIRIRTLMIAMAVAAFGLGQAFRSGTQSAVHAISNKPEIAVQQEKWLGGVLWGLSYEQAIETGRRQRKPTLVYFASVVDSRCAWMDESSFTRSDIISMLAQFVTVRLDTDFVSIESISLDQREFLAQKNLALKAAITGDVIVPSFVVLTEQGTVLAAIAGYRTPDEFSAFLRQSLAKLRRGPPGGSPKAH
jgi:hypothetical protein